jgi:hypothetical protein
MAFPQNHESPWLSVVRGWRSDGKLQKLADNPDGHRPVGESPDRMTVCDEIQQFMIHSSPPGWMMAFLRKWAHAGMKSIAEFHLPDRRVCRPRTASQAQSATDASASCRRLIQPHCARFVAPARVGAVARGVRCASRYQIAGRILPRRQVPQLLGQLA